MFRIVTAVVPEFVTVSGNVFLVGICTVPKLSVLGLATRVPDVVVPVPEI
jgi:hypothetical protein